MALLTHDEEYMREVLSNLRGSPLSQDAMVRRILIMSLGELQDMTDVSTAILSTLFVEENLWLLSSVHPDLRLFAWGLEPQGLSSDSVLLWLSALPQSDILSQAHPKYMRERWQNSLIDYMSTLSIEEKTYLLGYFTLQSQVLKDVGYPLRSEQYREVVQVIAAKEGVDLSPFESSIGSDEDTPSDQNEEEPIESKEKVPVDPIVLEKSALDLLRTVGFVLTTSSSILAEPPAYARVDQVIYSTSEKDHVFSFRIDIEKNLVDQITVNGQKLPNEVPWEAFVTWLKN